MALLGAGTSDSMSRSSREVYIKQYKSLVAKTYSAKEVAQAVGTNWSAA
jgi:hypothetical protein